MRRIALVEGAFDPLTAQEASWLTTFARSHGRVHVALWPEGETALEARIAALKALSTVWDVHVGRVMDVLPWLREAEPDAQITILARSSSIFAGDSVTLPPET